MLGLGISRLFHLTSICARASCRLTVSCISLLILVQCSETTSAAARPILYSFDAGCVLAGTVVEHSFRIRNPDEMPIEVVDVRTSCGCTTVEETKGVLEPEEEISVPVVWRTDGESGLSKATVGIYFSNKQYALLEINAYIESADGLVVDVGKSFGADKQETRFFVERSDACPFEVLEMGYDTQKLSIVPAEDDAKGLAYTVTPGASLPFGLIRESVYIVTDSEQFPQKHALIKGYHPFPIEPDTYELAVGQVEAGETIEREIELFSPYGEEVSLDSCSAAKGRLEWSTSRKSDSEVLLKLQLLIVNPEGALDFSDIIRVSASTPEHQREFSINVFGVF